MALSSKRTSGGDHSTLFFLSSRNHHGSAPLSGDITGIRKQLKDEMSPVLANAQMAGEDRMANHVALSAAEEREVASFRASSRVKLTRHRGFGVQAASMKGNSVETKRSLAAEPAESCGSQSSEWKERRECLRNPSPCMTPPSC